MLRHLQVSTKNAEFQIIEALKTNRSKRTKLGQAFLEGIEGIKQAASAGIHFSRVIFPQNRKLSDWGKDFLQNQRIDCVVEMDGSLYKELCDREEPSEFLATFRRPLRRLGDLQPTASATYVLFDRPSDKGNLGSIVRTANSFGIDGAIILGHAVDPFDSKVIRASLGAVFHTPIYEVESMESLDLWLQNFRNSVGGTLVGTDSTGSTQISDHAFPGPLVLALGNESKGLSRNLLERCDAVLSIPGVGQVNSLNVACAGSILLWEIFKSAQKPVSGPASAATSIDLSLDRALQQGADNLSLKYDEHEQGRDQD